MGILSDTVFRNNPKARSILSWIKELGVLAVFLLMALGLRQEWLNGFETCKSQACLVCWHAINGSKPSEGNITEIINRTLWVEKLVDCEQNRRAYYEFETVAKEVALLNFSLHPCYFYTQELGRKLDGLGYMVRCKRNANHEWLVLELPIEATTGEIILPEAYESYSPNEGYCQLFL